MKDSCPDSERSTCIGLTLHILGEKWTALMLNSMEESPKTFGELEITLLGISPRTLSSRLDKLETAGIITKKQYCPHPPRYRYNLTPKGKELHGVLSAMANWGNKYSRELASTKA